ncbi:Por secretion system C-terminal sorting domain-containing protein [Lishizhenia tianjinensis]|uniref:Por secretion system C-terminal sorting domain-containing protein n=1 Tax=Lishizhenia tianjinensis TaxID=477690 RepID=A0A1I6ZQK8_9FLAO|nr:Por secretion system C-terminal sorting domain-containing protein [Lishizhenia tianjinensis]
MMLLPFLGAAQIYFPPSTSNQWDTLGVDELGWCDNYVDSLYDYLSDNNTKAFILMKDGKIVLEQYFDGFQSDDFWYWASAGKTLTAFSIGLAQQQGALNINDTTSDYLGSGWTSLTTAQEEKITIKHQLSMTSGLDDISEFECTADSCLTYLADAGTRWAYHNAPYTLLTDVLEQATGQIPNFFVAQHIKNPTGMDGVYINQGFNKVYTSTPRSMARFSLLMLNNGNWDGTPIMTDANYFSEMVNSSQNLNEAYGYLWWLNGKNSFMLPSTQVVLPGKLFPNAPDETYAALGKNGQFINVLPSQGITWIRMGNAPSNLFVPYLMNDEIWQRLNGLMCTTNAVDKVDPMDISLYPNPAQDVLHVEFEKGRSGNYRVLDVMGREVLKGRFENELKVSVDVAGLEKGVYRLLVEREGSVEVKVWVKE